MVESTSTDKATLGGCVDGTLALWFILDVALFVLGGVVWLIGSERVAFVVIVIATVVGAAALIMRLASSRA